MKAMELNTLKQGQKLFVSYKGIRPCTFKNLKGKCAFVEFDNGDGTGVRLHRVLATTLVMKQPKAEPKAEPKAAKGKSIDNASDFELLKALADRLGYAITEK